MANSISYFEVYTNMLDEIYKQGSKTAILEVNPLAVKFSQEDAKTVYLKEITVEGLGTYSRSTGYASGDVDNVHTAYTVSQDRGKKFTLDALDLKQAKLEVLEIAKQFQTEKVVPELDAYRFEKLCTTCSLDASADLTYDTAIEAVDTAIQTLDDARHLA